jgi:predicted amidohydrolase
MPQINVTLVQLASSLDPAENRQALTASADLIGAHPKPDLVVFPEAFACDFGKPGTDISEFAEAMDGPFVQAMTSLAEQHAVTVIAGMFERSEDPGRPYNTLAVVDAGGLRAAYRKMHLYDSFGYKESDRLLAGEVKPVVLDIGGLGVGLMTCYDLRFPELARELTRQGADLIVAPSAWVAGDRKVDHWRTLVRARAIENTVYVAAAAQPGPRYTGHSMIVGPLGDVLMEAEDTDPAVSSPVGSAVVEEARNQNPSLANRRF